MVSPMSVPRIGIGMNDPATPPNAAPIALKIACPAGSPDSKDTIPTTSGPTIGILPKNLERNGLAPLNAGAITPADLPNIFAANPLDYKIKALLNLDVILFLKTNPVEQILNLRGSTFTVLISKISFPEPPIKVSAPDPPLRVSAPEPP